MDTELFKIEYLSEPLIYVLLIFLAILVHESGHYLAARLFNMPVDSIVIGRGRTLKWWKDKKGTRWSVRFWPVGAHIHVSGFQDGETHGEYAGKPFWQRAVTILAGPGMNFLILPFLFFGFYVTFGQPSTPPVLVGVEKGLAAERVGLKPGDRFLAVDGIELSNFQDIWRVAYAKGPVESLYTIKRGEENFELPFTPGWTEYTDESGIERKNARFGVIWEHNPFKLSALTNIGDVDVSGKPDLAREQLLKHMGKDVVIGLKAPNVDAAFFTVHLFANVNKNLNNPEHENFERVYLGQTPGNIYLQQDISGHGADALRMVGGLIATIATVPFQLFPIDQNALRDSNAVSDPETHIINKLYKYLYLFAVACVVVGLINLLPLPGLDGGQLLNLVLEKISASRITRRRKAQIFGLAFFILYLSILFSNLDNVPGYIDSRVKKVHEVIKNSTLLKKDEAGNG